MRANPFQLTSLIFAGSMLTLSGIDAGTTLRTIRINACVPEGAGAVYLTGNLPELGPWDPGKFCMQGSGVRRSAVLQLPEGFLFEYKLTLGTWDREGLGPSGTVMPNHRLLVTTNEEVTVVIVDFKKGTSTYIESWRESGVLGRLDYWTNVTSDYLEGPRHVEIWLPPDYDKSAGARYPVLYMHDGQNLFDPRIANTGVDWGVDEAVVRGAAAGNIPSVIVVGVWCTGLRAREYSPWDLGPDYARFLIEELKPKVDAEFRTRTGPEDTLVMGSSMGGLISFYLCWKHPEVFGKGGCLSTHFPYSAANLSAFRGDHATASSMNRVPLIKGEIASGATFPAGVRMYFDYGTGGPDGNYEAVTTEISDWLTGQGLEQGKDFVVKKFPGAEHNEGAWRKRLDEPLNFLLGR